METKIKNLLARLAFFAEDGMAEAPIVAIAKDADALLKEMCRAQPEPAQQAEPVAWLKYPRKKPELMQVSLSEHLPVVLKNSGWVSEPLYAQPPAQPDAMRSVTNISMETVGGNHRVVLHVGTVGEMYELGKVIRAMFAAEGCGACGDGCKGQGCRLERESPPTCLFCNGRGIVSRYAQDGSHDDAPCPNCAAQKGGA